MDDISLELSSLNMKDDSGSDDGTILNPQIKMMVMMTICGLYTGDSSNSASRAV